MTPARIQQQHRKAREHLLNQDFARAFALYQHLVRCCPRSAVVWFEYR